MPDLRKDDVMSVGSNIVAFNSPTANTLPIDVSPTNPLPVTVAAGATSLGKVSGGTWVTGDNGIAVWTVRQNTLTALEANAKYGPLLTDTNGALWVALGTLIAGEDQVNNRMLVMPSYSFTNITTNTTTTVKSGAGVFHGFTINNNGFTTAGTITIYDNTAGSGTKIGTWTIPLEPPGTVLLATVYVPPQLGIDAAFATGLTIVTATTAPAVDMTVLYK